MSKTQWIQAYCARVSRNFSALEQQSIEIETAAYCVKSAIEGGGKVMLCGNGGSAADAQHIAAEFVGHFMGDREALPALALTTDSSILTSVGNDLGFKNIFSRQVSALGKPSDILIAISTSGNSENIINAAQAAKHIGIKTIALTGQKHSKLSALCDVVLQVPSDETNHIQEMHIAIGHMICAIAEGSAE